MQQNIAFVDFATFEQQEYYGNFGKVKKSYTYL
jgi:hypothetical protein